jgi:hypothetical protein
MKKLFGILGTVVGAGLLGLGVANLVKKNNDDEDDGYVTISSNDEEVDGEDESEEE